jgi:glycerate kinase
MLCNLHKRVLLICNFDSIYSIFALKTKRLLISTDSMKGVMSSFEFSNNVAEIISNIIPNIDLVVKPMSDGGDGFLDVIQHFPETEKIINDNKDCLMRDSQGYYFYHTHTKTAYIELAHLSGLHLLKSNEKNPYFTSTYGTGIQIQQAIDQGAKKIVLGLGGSATNDGGVGILYALGFTFISTAGLSFFPQGIDGLKNITSVQPPSNLSYLKNITFDLVVDVQNPLLGENGATAVYGIQKGVRPSDVVAIDAYLYHYAQLLYKEQTPTMINQPGMGAAGGTALSLSAFFNIKFTKGFDYLSKWYDLEKEIQQADFIITGEGSTDVQTLYGKVPMGVLNLCEKYNKPCLLVSGMIDHEQEFVKRYLMAESLYQFATNKEDSMIHSNVYLKKAVQLMALRLKKEFF